MKIEKLLQDYRIDFVTEHKNIREGWIGLDCPFCGSNGKYHLGYSLDENYFSCWQCGGHSTEHTLQRLLRISREKAESIIKKYGGKSKKKRIPKVRTGASRFLLPPGDELEQRHKRYLIGRGFDEPTELENLWGLRGTTPIAKIDAVDYGNRVLAPIYWDGRMVSFQARDITEKHMAKYMACPPEREIILHKHILYGIQDYWTHRGVCVEGITDVWRFGVHSFATFGVKFTRQQVRAMKDHFDEVIVIYDPEEQAQAQADRLIKELNYKNVKARKLDIHCDPGDLSQEEADIIMSDLMKGV